MADVFLGSPDDVRYYLRKYTIQLQKHTFTAEFDDGFLSSTVVLNHAHNHAAMELIAVKSGECCVNTLDASYRCEKGSVLLIPSGIYHSNARTSVPPERHSFRIYIDNSPERDNSNPLYDRLTSLDSPLLLESPSLISTITDIHSEMQHPGPFSVDMIKALLKQCFITLLRTIDSEGQKDGEAEPETKTNLTEDRIEDRIKRIEWFFTRYHTKQVTLKDLADYIYTSPSQTNRILFSRYGCYFREKLRETRLHQAIILLEITTLSINEIAFQVGYRSPPSFFEAFKNTFGVTPSEYRKTKRQSRQRSSE